MGVTWNPIEPNWLGFLSFIAVNCFFTQASRILLTEMTASRCPAEIRGYAMGTVTSLTAVSRAACDVILGRALIMTSFTPNFYLTLASTVLFSVFQSTVNSHTRGDNVKKESQI